MDVRMDVQESAKEEFFEHGRDNDGEDDDDLPARSPFCEDRDELLRLLPTQFVGAPGEPENDRQTRPEDPKALDDDGGPQRTPADDARPRETVEQVPEPQRDDRSEQAAERAEGRVEDLGVLAIQNQDEGKGDEDLNEEDSGGQPDGAPRLTHVERLVGRRRDAPAAPLGDDERDEGGHPRDVGETTRTEGADHSVKRPWRGLDGDANSRRGMRPDM